MFLEDILLENDDDILEGEGFMESDDDLDLFSEALSLNGVKGAANKGLQKVGLKKKPLTKKEKVIKAVKNVDKKKVAKMLGVIGGALATGAIIITAAKKIKASKAAKDGQIDTKAVDEKVGIVKQAMSKLKSLRTKFSRAERKAKKDIKKVYSKNLSEELSGYGSYSEMRDAMVADGRIAESDIKEVNKLTAVIKKIYNWIVNVGKAAGCKVSGAKDAVKKKFMKESALMDNTDYATAFEAVMDGSVEEFNSFMENVALDAFLGDYVIEDVMEALESGAYDEEDDDDFDF